MEITDLKIFISVAEEKNFTKSAEKLGYVQSNISSRMSKLEKDVNTKLFIRHPKGVSLTDSGNFLLNEANNIIRRISYIEEKLKDFNNKIDQLTIGYVETIQNDEFTTLLKSFKDNNKNVELRVKTGSSPSLLEDILEYKLDAAFISGEIDEKDINVEFTFTDKIVIVNKNKLSSLNNLTWVVFSRNCPFRKRLVEWHNSNISNTKIDTIEVTSIDTMINLVKTGIAATILPESLIKDLIAEEYYIKMLPDNLSYMQSHLITNKHKKLDNKMLLNFVDLIKSKFS